MAMVCMVTVFYHFIFFKSDESINILYCVLRYHSAFFNYCIWRILTAGFAEQNGRNAKLNGRITFDY